MGREIKRVPLDYDFPIGKSFSNAKQEEPPKGEGWQLWQTISDEPISPVFRTPEELIDFMSAEPSNAEERDRLRRGCLPWAQGYARETAERFVRGPGWAPSAVIVGGVLMSGVDFVTKDEKGEP